MIGRELRRLIREVTTGIPANPHRAFGRCVYCGRPCYGRSCSAHRDLLILEQQLHAHDNDPDRTTTTGARPGPSTTGG